METFAPMYLLLRWANFEIYNFELAFADWVVMQTSTQYIFTCLKSTMKELKQGMIKILKLMFFCLYC